MSSNDGAALERDTLHILRLFPGAELENEKLILGKKVDNYCVLTNNGLAPPFRIAVECKDYARTLTREQVAKITADYLPLLSQRAVDQVLLVTRNGIVPNAKEVFDGV